MKNKKTKFNPFYIISLLVVLAAYIFVLILCIQNSLPIIVPIGCGLFLALAVVIAYMSDTAPSPYQYSVKVLVKPDGNVSEALRHLADCIDEQDYLNLLDQEAVDNIIRNDEAGWTASIFKF